MLCVDGRADRPHASSMKLSVVFGVIPSMSGSRVFSRYSVDDNIVKIVSRNRAYAYYIISFLSYDFNYIEVFFLVIVHKTYALVRIELFKMMNELSDKHCIMKLGARNQIHVCI